MYNPDLGVPSFVDSCRTTLSDGLIDHWDQISAVETPDTVAAGALDGLVPLRVQLMSLTCGSTIRTSTSVMNEVLGAQRRARPRVSR